MSEKRARDVEAGETLVLKGSSVQVTEVKTEHGVTVIAGEWTHKMGTEFTEMEFAPDSTVEVS